MSERRSGADGYGAGTADTFGAAGYHDGPVRRTFRDYVLILRERLWYVVIVFLVVFLASLVYTLSATKQYTAAASIEILAKDPVVLKVEEVRDEDIRSPEDLNTQVKLLESGAIVQKVAQRLTPDDAKVLLAPYQNGGSGDPLVPEEVLAKYRGVLPARMTRIIQISYTHADPEMAAKIANLFAEEFIDYNVRWRVDESLRAVEDLKIRADEQAKKVQELGNELQVYKERNNMVSLDQRKDIVTEKLKALNGLMTDDNSKLSEAQVRLNQVQECRRTGGDLANLPFIAGLPNVQHLQQEIGAQKVSIADLAQRFRPKYPTMKAALDSLAQNQAELAQELDNAAASVEEGYETAKRDYAQAKTDLANQEAEALKLDRFSVDYGTLQNELNVNQELLANILTRMRETTMSASIESQNARIIDPASRPRKPSSPNIALNLAAGAFGGLGLGLALAFVIAFIDDRVKSAYQVETVIGLPLIGIIPKIRKMDGPSRAKVVLNNADPLVAEAFLTIHSNLRLKSESQHAKAILVTSTRPSEGKSFVASNLALAFAKHGERTILVDCDLRKPNVHNEFGVPNTTGVIDYCAEAVPLDKVIVTGRIPHLDLLPAGGRAANPTNILNGAGFTHLVDELRSRYDRIVFDTPPLAPVSDAMIILPHVDGVIFTIRFNHVHARGARFCARRILETKIPCLGAVMNGLDLALSDYYYAEYYDKSYKDYVGSTEASG